jgi:sulfatase maturation enzyme AslB (radical SAM superfamily)
MSQNTTELTIPSEFDLVLCIGDGSANSDQQSRAIAESLNIPYNYVLDVNTTVVTGVYHTSVYDIKLAQIYDKVKNHRVKIQVLNISIENFKTPNDYAACMAMTMSLSKSFTVEYSKEKSRSWYFKELANNKAFCAMPFIGVHQTQSGGSHCCHMPALWKSKVDFFGEASLALRQKVLSGIRVPECKFCYDLEEHGGVSDRVSWSHHWAGNLASSSREDMINHTNIKIFHLDLDNTCNLMCRMCSPKYSNLIDNEYKKLNLLNDNSPENFPRQFMPDIDLAQLTKLMVTGGEPTINTKFLRLLESLIGTKQQDLSISVSTNAAVFTRRMKKIVNYLPNLRFSISIDGFDKVNQYIRWPIKWNKMMRNIDYLYNEKRISNFKTTVSMYNVSSLHDLYTWINSVYPGIPCTMNFVQRPNHMTPWNYPDKLAVFDSLEKIKALSIYQQDHDMQSNIRYIESAISSWVFDPKLAEQFYQFNDTLDQSRGVVLQDYIGSLESYRCLASSTPISRAIP